MPCTWSAYEGDPRSYADLYESLPFERVHASILGLIPPVPQRVLDIGAGSGRDAAWFAGQGHDVVACEPSAAMRREAQSRHPEAKVRWLGDALPDLPTLARSGVTFDLVLLSGVWMHLHPSDRPRAFRKLAALLAPKGRLIISLRHGPDFKGQGFHPVTEGELEVLGSHQGLQCIHQELVKDTLGRDGVNWSILCFRLPDDGTGALSLLRSLILRDPRSSSYKLGLLRVLCRIAEQHPGLARENSPDSIELPLGLVALTWLRAYLPLFRAGLRQHPQSANSFSDTLEPLGDLDPQDLRPGLAVIGPTAIALRASIRAAARTIRKMPANYLKSPEGQKLFPVQPENGAAPAGSGGLTLDEPTLWSFGTFQVPARLWQAFCRFSPWIDPLLRQTWAEYMEGLSGAPHQGLAWNALEWVDPVRNTSLARTLAAELKARGGKIHCVWSGQELRTALDIDHCFPVAAWACQDLWNLLPAAPAVNNSKRDRLISGERLHGAQERILDWWDRAYLRTPREQVAERFSAEARMTLALGVEGIPSLEAILAGVDLKRMALGGSRELEIWA